MAAAMTRSNVWMINAMNHYLTENLQATTEEIDHLKHLCSIKSNKKAPIKGIQSYLKPSLIIDNFLYHGDLSHALNMNLLNELKIKHILNVCDRPLDQEINDQFNVLWINIDDDLNAEIRKYFDKTNDFLIACHQKNEKVLVNCQMGISRSSSIVLAYLLK